MKGQHSHVFVFWLHGSSFHGISWVGKDHQGSLSPSQLWLHVMVNLIQILLSEKCRLFLINCLSCIFLNLWSVGSVIIQTIKVRSLNITIINGIREVPTMSSLDQLLQLSKVLMVGIRNMFNRNWQCQDLLLSRAVLILDFRNHTHLLKKKNPW